MLIHGQKAFQTTFFSMKLTLKREFPKRDKLDQNSGLFSIPWAFKMRKMLTHVQKFDEINIENRIGLPKRDKIDQNSLLNPMILNIFISKIVILEQKVLKMWFYRKCWFLSKKRFKQLFSMKLTLKRGFPKRAKINQNSGLFSIPCPWLSSSVPSIYFKILRQESSGGFAARNNSSYKLHKHGKNFLSCQSFSFQVILLQVVPCTSGGLCPPPLGLVMYKST